jgi:hypothetical protein
MEILDDWRETLGRLFSEQTQTHGTNMCTVGMETEADQYVMQP